MGYILFYDAAAGADEVINLSGLLNVTASTNAVSIGYQVGDADGAGAQATIDITSTGNGAAIKSKILAAIRLVDGGGSTVIDMTDTATTTATAVNGFA